MIKSIHSIALEDECLIPPKVRPVGNVPENIPNAIIENDKAPRIA
jgi:hypothetical protein